MENFNFDLTQEQIDALINGGVNQGDLPGNDPAAGTTGTPDTTTLPPNATNPPPDVKPDPVLSRNAQNITDPKLPTGGTYTPVMQEAKDGELLQASNYALGDVPKVGTKTVANTQTVAAPARTAAASYEATTIGQNAPQTTAQQGTVSAEAKVQAEQQQGLSQELKDTLDSFKQELSQIGLDPNETTAGQYSKLMDFGPDEIPAWAKGAYNAAKAEMARRGISGSTVAGEAVTRALMQAALPIAAQDAQALQTLKLNVLDKKAQGVFLRAGYIAQLDMQNLNNRQQAAVVNAQSFLAMDMRNLDNRQQAAIITTQARLQAMLSDQAAVNSAKQFNAQSIQQTDQFYANLATQIETFNAAQKNAMEQYNTSELNATEKFNSEMENQREQFNVKNSVIIDQANAAYLRGINTQNTAAVNQANYVNSQNLLQISTTAMANELQLWRDNTAYLFTASQNQLDRDTRRALMGLSQEQWFQRNSQSNKDALLGGIGGVVANIFGEWSKTWFDDEEEET